MTEVEKCDLCGGKEFKRKERYEQVLGIKEKFMVVQCSDCHLVFLNPLPGDSELKSIYSREYYDIYKMESLTEQRVNHDFKQRLYDCMQMGITRKKVLDVGAGFGGFMKIFKDNGFEVYGTELSEIAIKEAKKKYGVDIMRIDLLDMEGFDEYFDIIHAHHVLEHCRCPSKYFKKIYSLLKPSGLFIFEVPNEFRNLYRCIQKILKRDFKYMMYPSLHHSYFFGKRIMDKYLKKYSFEIIRYKGYSELDLSPPEYKMVNFIKKIFFKVFGHFGYAGVHNYICKKIIRTY